MDEFVPAVLRVHAKLAAHRWTVATAESCTGGLLSAALTHVAGASTTFERGYVTYSNTAKSAELLVPADLIARHGAVSAEVAAAMASGCLERAGVDVAIAITGVAGPAGGSPEKPVGLVYFGSIVRGRPAQALEKRFGDQSRASIRTLSVHTALALVEEALDQSSFTGAP